MEITKERLYLLIDESIDGIEDWECCLDSRKKQIKIIKTKIKELKSSQK